MDISTDLALLDTDLLAAEFDVELPSPSSQSTPRVGISDINRWDPRLVIDIALGVDALPDILERYNLTLDQYEHLYTSTTFRRELALTIKDVKENGLSFASKCKALAETYLETIDDIVNNDEVAAGVRLDGIKSVVHWGRLEPPKNAANDQQAQPTVNVQINF